MAAVVEREHVDFREEAVADLEARSAQAHRRGFFDGETEGFGGAAERSRSLGSRALAIAAEVELGSVVKAAAQLRKRVMSIL